MKRDNPFRSFGRTDLEELYKIFCSSARGNKRADRLRDALLQEIHLQQEAEDAVDREDERIAGQ